MIVKDEAHIIHESLKATLPLIDTYCIVDTGSSDDTIQKIRDFYSDKGIYGEIHERPWKNFGHNRSEALKLCDGKMDYILVIDADDLMGFPSNGKEILTSLLEKEQPNGVQIMIKQSTIEYWRTQIFKANDDWKYVGVLHEYPSNGKQCKQMKLPLSFWMESRRLGGRSRDANKMKRDIAVLTKGLEEEPDNERYVFYLAQSYKDDGNFEQSLKYYKKRFKMGRWAEEAWYSAYRVGECYKMLGNIPKFEYWMQKAHMFRPQRAEPIYQLTEFFRVNSQLHKAYHYAQIGRKIAYPKDDVLFVEKFPHEGGFDYECSILDYYIHTDKKIGLRDSVNYLLKRGDHIQNVVANMKFYMSSIASNRTPLNIPNPFGEEFRPSAVSLIEYPLANVRFVNYLIPYKSDYRTRDGTPIQTHNAIVNLETGEVIQKMTDSTNLQKRETSVKGLEDIRVYKKNSETWFTATSYKEYSPNISILNGKYNTDGTYTDVSVVDSPTNSPCEKNWTHIPNTDLTIYSWSPYRVGRIEGNHFKVVTEVQTPPLFSLFRGSASPIQIGNDLIALVHFVEYCTPRNYYHCFVKLDGSTYTPTAISLPFVFEKPQIEFSTSMRLMGSTIECFASFFDANPSRVSIPLSSIEWIGVKIEIPMKSVSIHNVPDNATTFVTALIDLKEERPTGKDLTSYLNHFKQLANTGVPLHVFISESYFMDFNTMFGNMPNIHVELKELEELETVKQLDGVEYSRASVIVEHTKQTLNYNRFNNSKTELVYLASKKNCFNTPQFAWIDFGINHVIKNKETYKHLLKTKLNTTKLIVPSIWDRSKERASDFNHINWRFAGGFFIGKKSSIEEFYDLYRSNFKGIISSKKVLPCEASIWAYFEEFCNWKIEDYKSDHNDTILMIPEKYLLNNQTTFVTAFIDPNEIRPDLKSVEKYFEHFKELANTGIPLHVFIDKNLVDNFNKIFCSYSNIYTELVDIQDLEISKQIKDLDFSLPEVRCPVKDTKTYMIIINSKIQFIKNAIDKNIFGNQQFAWIDFGINHVIKNKETYQRLKKLKILPKGIYAASGSSSKISDDFNNVNWRFLGGFICGDSHSLLEFYNIYMKEFRNIVKETKILSWEVNYWTYLDNKFNLKINTYPASFNDSILTYNPIFS